MKKKFVHIYANKNSSLFLIFKVAAPPAVALLKLVDRSSTFHPFHCAIVGGKQICTNKYGW